MKHNQEYIELYEKLGKNMQKYRIERRMTIEELSEQTGIRTEYLKKIENGKAYRVLFDKHLLKIARSLNIKISELFE